MPRYGPVWLEIALEQYASLSTETREQVDGRIEQLLENPRQPPGGYDGLTDQWTTVYGSGAGLIVYAVFQRPPAEPSAAVCHGQALSGVAAAGSGLQVRGESQHLEVDVGGRLRWRVETSAGPVVEGSSRPGRCRGTPEPDRLPASAALPAAHQRAARRQRYGVVVDTLTRPDRSRIGREYSVESLLMSVLPMRSAERAREAVNAR